MSQPRRQWTRKAKAVSYLAGVESVLATAAGWESHLWGSGARGEEDDRRLAHTSASMVEDDQKALTTVPTVAAIAAISTARRRQGVPVGLRTTHWPRSLSLPPAACQSCRTACSTTAARPPPAAGR